MIECDCADYESDGSADDDWAPQVCVCGHLDDEHTAGGFFRPCLAMVSP